MIRENKGIVSIALVTASIISITLSTVTVASIEMISASNGIINRAQQAKTLQEEAVAKEELDIILLGYNLSNENRKVKGESQQTLAEYLKGEEGVEVLGHKGEYLVVKFKDRYFSINIHNLSSYEIKDNKNNN